METFFMRVGYTMTRPVIPDEFVTFVTIQTDKGINDARTIAAQWVASGKGVEMVTTVDVIMVEI